MTDSALLTIRVSGQAAEGGRLPLAELGRIASEFQATVERIALGLRGLLPAAGPRPRQVVDAVGMEIWGLGPGSTVMTIGRTHERGTDADLLADALEALEAGMADIAADRAIPEVFTAVVLDGLLRLAGGVADGSLAAIEIERGGRTTVRFDRETHGRVRRARRGVVVTTTCEVVGRLQMGDFARGAMRCRIDTVNGAHHCTFPEELGEIVLRSMGSLVRAWGVAELRGDGSIRSLELEGIEKMPATPQRTLDELAREQNVRPLGSLDELALTEPLSDEEYERFRAATRSLRGD